MVKKLLGILFVILFFAFSVSKSQAQSSQDITCSATNPCPSQINCSVGCLPVSLTCVNGLCRVPTGGSCTATTGMSNGGCQKTNSLFATTENSYYCTRNAAQSTMTCQPSKPDGTACTDNLECQPNYVSGGNKVCAANQCNQTPGVIAASCCSVGTFWCASNSRCTAQGDGSCPCAITPLPSPTPTATLTQNGTPPPISDPPPINCSSGGSGVSQISFGLTSNSIPCLPNPLGENPGATAVCNDGTVITLQVPTCVPGNNQNCPPVSTCTPDADWKMQAITACASHTTCTSLSPSPVTTSAQALTCDPDTHAFEKWKSEAVHTASGSIAASVTGPSFACFKPDTVIDIFDFNVWRDVKWRLHGKVPF